MAVALRGYTQGTTQASGQVDIAWPSGTVAGDFAVLVAQDNRTNGPVASGWASYTAGVWTKRVTSSDLAGPLTVKGKTTFLQTFTGAARIGSTRWSDGLKLTQAGAGLFVDGWGPARVNTVDPGATNRLGNQIRLITDNTPNAVWFIAHSTTGYKTLTSHDDDCSYVSFEILPIAGPNAPVLVVPTAGSQVDASTAITLSWIHQSNSATTQEQVQIRIRVVGAGVWSYVQSAGTITTTVTTLTQSAETKNINSGVLTTGSQYEWAVATVENGVMGPFSPTQTFTPVAKPTVNSITPTSVNNDLSPTIAWTATMGVGSQEAWQVRIVDSALTTPDVFLWDSLVNSGNATSTVAPTTVPWTNGQDLYAWVRVSQTGGLWSPWTKDNATFEVTWTPPAAPSSVTPANIAGMPLQVTVTGIGVGYTVELEASTDGANTWTHVTSRIADATSEVFEVPLAGYGVPTAYRARTSTQIDTVTIWSNWVISSEVASTDTGSYLVTDDGTSYLPVQVRDDGAVTTVQGVSVTYGHGADKPRQDQTIPMGLAGQTTLITHSITDQAAVETFLTTQQVWYLRWAPETSPGQGRTNKPATRMALAAQIGTGRVIQAAHASRTISFAWVEQ